MRQFSVKPGRGPSAFGAIGGIISAVFGVFWTILAINITADSPFPIAKIIFPLFGVLFIIASIAGVIYNGYNATQPDRFSNLDVEATDSDANAVASSATLLKDQTRGKYCTNCGTGMRDLDKFCSECGTPAR